MLKKLVILLILAGCAHSQNTLETQVILADPGVGQTREGHEAKGQKYMITTQGVYSSKAAKKMFDMGGSIADAAAAASFVLAVERPQSTGIGGGGFLMYYDAKKNKDSNPWAYDFREKAPINSKQDMFLDKDGKVMAKKSIDGIYAAGVPGMVAGIVDFHHRFGKLPLKTVMAPAIELANEGFKVYPELAKALEFRAPILGRFSASKKIFFNKKGEHLKEGDLLVQKDLAVTLTKIAKHGANGFYKGDVANKIIEENQRLGGLLTKEDLEKYNVVVRRPVSSKYKDYEVFSMSPPSSGGVHVVEILNIIEKDNLKQYGPHHPKTIHLVSSAMQASFVDRARYMGDADFVEVPVMGLTSKKYAKDVRYTIPESRALNKMWAGNLDPFLYQKLSVKNEHDETTHFSIMDGEGNVVASTQTINGLFGSGVVVPGTGIVLNNEMDDFSAKAGVQNLFGAVGSDKNLVEPEKRPLSSMSPTIVFKNGEPLLALGTPNGTRILTCTALTILNFIEHELPLYESVNAVRYHHQWQPDEILVEKKGLPEKTVKSLMRMEHQLKFEDYGCRVQAVAKNGETLYGVSDIRGRGYAVGK